MLTSPSHKSHWNSGCTFWHRWQFAEWINDMGPTYCVFAPQLSSVLGYSLLMFCLPHSCLGHMSMLVKVDKPQNRHLEFVIYIGSLSTCTWVRYSLESQQDWLLPRYHRTFTDSQKHLPKDTCLCCQYYKNKSERKILRSPEPTFNNYYILLFVLHMIIPCW